MEGKRAPDFSLPSDDGKTYSLSDFQGKWLVLYFYPRDNTSGCTTEAKEFSELLEEFRRLGAEVVGVSPQGPESHAKFRQKHGLKVLLLSDENREVIKAYGAWGVKKRYGKEHEGVIRSTFLIDPQGVIRKAWRNVRAKGHAAKVLEALKSLVGK